MVAPADEEIDRRILEAAEAEIDLNGLVGMRVATLAENAGTTVAMIYRRFADRDGLLAATLAAFYRRRLSGYLDLARRFLERPDPISIDDLVAAVPLVHFDGVTPLRHRLQRTYVAAMENTALQLAMQRVASELLPELDRAFERISQRLPEEQRFDPEILSIFVLRHNPIIDDILGDDGLTEAEFRDFLRSVLIASTMTVAR